MKEKSHLEVTDGPKNSTHFVCVMPVASAKEDKEKILFLFNIQRLCENKCSFQVQVFIRMII